MASSRTLTAPQRRFCTAFLTSKNATEAYLKAYPDSGAEAARRSASDMLKREDIKAEIERLREKADHRNGSDFLTYEEKRRLCARIARVEGAKIDEDLDADLINGVRYSKDGRRMLLIPDKIAAIKLDNDLAGDGSEAKGMSALAALAGRLRK